MEDKLVALNIMLERLGYTVLTATTPKQAIILAKDNISRIQLLITVVVIPEMSGRELSRLILAIQPSIHSLFTSGYAANIIAHHGTLDEGVQFLQKPFSFKDLGCMVHKSLAKENT